MCYSGQSKCGTLTALSSTCHADLHLRVPLPHVILRHALVGASVGQAKGSSKIQRAVGVGDDSLRQLTTGSGSRKRKQVKVSSLRIRLVLRLRCVHRHPQKSVLMHISAKMKVLEFESEELRVTCPAQHSNSHIIDGCNVFHRHL